MKIGILKRALKNFENRPPNHNFWAGLKVLSKLSGQPIYKLLCRIFFSRIALPQAGGRLLIIKIGANEKERVINEIEKSLKETRPSGIYIRTSFNSNDRWFYFPQAHELLEKYNYSLYNFYNIKRTLTGQFIYADALFISPDARKNL